MESLEDLRGILAQVDREQVFPIVAVRVPRGKSGGTQVVSLPHGYLDNLEDFSIPEEITEDALSGG
jgi:hypothetical protein